MGTRLIISESVQYSLEEVKLLLKSVYMIQMKDEQDFPILGRRNTLENPVIISVAFENSCEIQENGCH